MAKKNLWAHPKTVEGKTFYYVEIGKGFHYRVEYKVWVDPSFLVPNGSLFDLPTPVQGCDLRQGKKDLVLRKGDKNLFYIEIECGFRGQSKIDAIVCDDEPTIYYFDVYQSERGSLGISSGALVLTRSDRVKVRWHRSGRLYGKPSEGTTVFYLDGRQEEIEDESILTELEDLGGENG